MWASRTEVHGIPNLSLMGMGYSLHTKVFFTPFISYAAMHTIPFNSRYLKINVNG